MNEGAGELTSVLSMSSCKVGLGAPGVPTSGMGFRARFLQGEAESTEMPTLRFFVTFCARPLLAAWRLRVRSELDGGVGISDKSGAVCAVRVVLKKYNLFDYNHLNTKIPGGIESAIYYQ